MSLRRRYNREKTAFVWVMDFYDARGRRKRVSTGTHNRKIAERIYKQKLEAVAMERAGVIGPEGTPQQYPTITLVEFKDVCKDYLEGNRREKKTIALYSYALDSLIETLGALDFQDMTVRDIEAWKSRFLKDLSPTSVNIYQRALQTIFNVARKLGYIPHNPWNDVEVVSPSYSDDIPKVFRPHEIEKLFKGIGKDEPWLLWMVKHYLYTGMRRQEGIHLEREDYDFERNIIHIRNKPHLNWKTKTKRGRVVPLSPGDTDDQAVQAVHVGDQLTA